ncbi:hypothetical protein Lal_00035649, partial [Lupinus albus]
MPASFRLPDVSAPHPAGRAGPGPGECDAATALAPPVPVRRLLRRPDAGLLPGGGPGGGYPGSGAGPGCGASGAGWQGPVRRRHQRPAGALPPGRPGAGAGGDLPAFAPGHRRPPGRRHPQHPRPQRQEGDDRAGGQRTARLPGPGAGGYGQPGPGAPQPDRAGPAGRPGGRPFHLPHRRTLRTAQAGRAGGGVHARIERPGFLRRQPVLHPGRTAPASGAAQGLPRRQPQGLELCHGPSPGGHRLHPQALRPAPQPGPPGLRGGADGAPGAGPAGGAGLLPRWPLAPHGRHLRRPGIAAPGPPVVLRRHGGPGRRRPGGGAGTPLYAPPAPQRQELPGTDGGGAFPGGGDPSRSRRRTALHQPLRRGVLRRLPSRCRRPAGPGLLAQPGTAPADGGRAAPPRRPLAGLRGAAAGPGGQAGVGADVGRLHRLRGTGGHRPLLPRHHPAQAHRDGPGPERAAFPHPGRIGLRRHLDHGPQRPLHLHQPVGGTAAGLHPGGGAATVHGRGPDAGFHVPGGGGLCVPAAHRPGAEASLGAGTALQGRLHRMDRRHRQCAAGRRGAPHRPARHHPGHHRRAQTAPGTAVPQRGRGCGGGGGHHHRCQRRGGIRQPGLLRHDRLQPGGGPRPAHFPLQERGARCGFLPPTVGHHYLGQPLARRGGEPAQGRHALPRTAHYRPGEERAGRRGALRRHQARHFRTQAHRAAPGTPGPLRPAHRPAQPHPVLRPPAAGFLPRPALPGRPGGAGAGPGRLQGGERQPGPPGRRPAAGGLRLPPEADPAPVRHGGAHGRRRIHRAAARGAPGRGCGDRRQQGAGGPGAALRHPGPALPGQRQHRRGPVPPGLRQSRHAGAGRRWRHVRGQAGRQEPLGPGPAAPAGPGILIAAALVYPPAHHGEDEKHLYLHRMRCPVPQMAGPVFRLQCLEHPGGNRGRGRRQGQRPPFRIPGPRHAQAAGPLRDRDPGGGAPAHGPHPAATGPGRPGAPAQGALRQRRRVGAAGGPAGPAPAAGRGAPALAGGNQPGTHPRRGADGKTPGGGDRLHPDPVVRPAHLGSRLGGPGARMRRPADQAGQADRRHRDPGGPRDQGRGPGWAPGAGTYRGYGAVLRGRHPFLLPPHPGSEEPLRRARPGGGWLLRPGDPGRHPAPAGGNPGPGGYHHGRQPAAPFRRPGAEPAGHAAGGAAPPRRHRLLRPGRLRQCGGRGQDQRTGGGSAGAAGHHFLPEEPAPAGKAGGLRRGGPGRRDPPGAPGPGTAQGSGQAGLHPGSGTRGQQAAPAHSRAGSGGGEPHRTGGGAAAGLGVGRAQGAAVRRPLTLQRKRRPGAAVLRGEGGVAAGFRLWRWAWLPSLPGFLPSACATGRGSRPCPSAPAAAADHVHEVGCHLFRIVVGPLGGIGGVKTGGEGEDAGGGGFRRVVLAGGLLQRVGALGNAQHLVDAVDGGAEEQGLGVVAGLDRNLQGGFQNADLELLGGRIDLQRPMLFLGINTGIAAVGAGSLLAGPLGGGDVVGHDSLRNILAIQAWRGSPWGCPVPLRLVSPELSMFSLAFRLLRRDFSAGSGAGVPPAAGGGSAADLRPSPGPGICRRGGAAGPADGPDPGFPEHGDGGGGGPAGRYQGRLQRLSPAGQAAPGSWPGGARQRDTGRAPGRHGMAGRAPRHPVRQRAGAEPQPGPGPLHRGRGADPGAGPGRQLLQRRPPPDDEPGRPARYPADPARQPGRLPPAAGRPGPGGGRLPPLGRAPPDPGRAGGGRQQCPPGNPHRGGPGPAVPRSFRPAGRGAGRRRGGPGHPPLPAAPSRSLRRHALPGGAPGPGAGALPGPVPHSRPGRFGSGAGHRLRRPFRAPRLAGQPAGRAPAGTQPVARPAGAGGRTGAALRLRPAAPPATAQGAHPAGAAAGTGGAGRLHPRHLRHRPGGPGRPAFLGRRRAQAGGLRRRRLHRRPGPHRPHRPSGPGPAQAPAPGRAGGGLRLALRLGRFGAALPVQRGPDRCPVPGPDGPAAAHRYPGRPDAGLAPGLAAGRAQPLRHQHPARAAPGSGGGPGAHGHPRRTPAHGPLVRPRRTGEGWQRQRLGGKGPGRNPGRESGRRADLHRGRRAGASHRHQPAQAQLGFHAGQFLRPGSARRAGTVPGQLHHQLPPARRCRQPGGGTGQTLPQPDCGGCGRHRAPAAISAGSGLPGGAVRLPVHPGRRDHRPLRRPGRLPRRAALRTLGAARPGRRPPATAGRPPGRIRRRRRPLRAHRRRRQPGRRLAPGRQGLQSGVSICALGFPGGHRRHGPGRDPGRLARRLPPAAGAADGGVKGGGMRWLGEYA